MIIGLGLDLEDPKRIENVFKNDSRRINKIYTELEQEYCEKTKKDKFVRYASIWAAKEATMKALGTGNNQGINFIDIEIYHEKSGKPGINLYGKSYETAKKLGVTNKVVSMSNLENIVSATVIFEK